MSRVWIVLAQSNEPSSRLLICSLTVFSCATVTPYATATMRPQRRKGAARRTMSRLLRWRRFLP
jgi:hypothetical protein